MANSLEVLSGGAKKEYAKEAQAVADETAVLSTAHPTSPWRPWSRCEVDSGP